MNVLEIVGERQAVWSATAGRLKAAHERTRWLTFALSTVGALLAVLASQQPDEDVRQYLAVAAAVLFGLVSVLTARFLGRDRTLVWLRARAAAEALKREAYKYAVAAAPYDDEASRDAILNQQRRRIERSVEDLMGIVVPSARVSTPSAPIAPEEYIARRIEGQIGWFEPKAEQARRTAAILRGTEFGLALTATCLAAIVGVIGPDPLGWGFDFVALTAVLTTIGGAIIAHVEAGRYEFTVAHYRSTALRLRDMRADIAHAFVAPSPEWSSFVDRCEEILSEENSTWLTERGKP